MGKLRSFINKRAKTTIGMTMDMQIKLPRITMIGDLHVYIENHRGILRFTADEIELNVSGGTLLINGEELVIKMLLSEEILIEGMIRSITNQYSTDQSEVKT
ncbi:sporulation protein YqfC [Amphibacillus marinus]|uniref:Sporulation protein YqfC n=1 Tax=Amphibacillus marinus TaxID=872970 RepID=A0A1H8HKI0_9BACI|nr:sporulation protein YqfC [Amphibacillus marinus]SEN56545.1 sporulation protein YqfC [Amphibacillus marinus]